MLSCFVWHFFRRPSSCRLLYDIVCLTMMASLAPETSDASVDIQNHEVEAFVQRSWRQYEEDKENSPQNKKSRTASDSPSASSVALKGEVLCLTLPQTLLASKKPRFHQQLSSLLRQRYAPRKFLAKRLMPSLQQLSLRSSLFMESLWFGLSLSSGPRATRPKRLFMPSLQLQVDERF